MKLNKVVAIPAIALAAGLSLVACGGGSSLTDQANAVMQLGNQIYAYGQPAPSSDVTTVTNANTAFQNAITITSDPTQVDQDYTTIGQALSQASSDASTGDWTDYSTEVDAAQTAIQAAQNDGTLGS